jgi:hypothetical protein
MAFRENLLKKIQIDQLASRVLATIGALGSEVKLDREAMRQLLALSPYAPQRVRDLDLYVEDTGTPVKQILVLDNELPIYRTTVADVAMRKSPTVGEMAKIWNIVKILKDSDVKISRKSDSLKAVQDESIARLDLSFGAEDINDIRRDGIASIESFWVSRRPPGSCGYPTAPSSAPSTSRTAARRCSARPSCSTSPVTISD